MSDPTTVNQPVQTADEIIRATIFDVAVNGIVLAASAELPWLKLPIISTVFKWVLTKFATFFYTYLSTVVSFSIIDSQTQGQATAYAAAVADLRAAHATGDPNALNTARAKFKVTLGDLIHFNGS